MSRSKATKRRKVWVREYGHELGSIAWHARREAIRRREGVREDATGVVRFVERLPGDVVLSREESERVRQFVLGSESRSVSTAEDEVLALLRGRR